MLLNNRVAKPTPHMNEARPDIRLPCLVYLSGPRIHISSSSNKTSTESKNPKPPNATVHATILPPLSPLHSRPNILLIRPTRPHPLNQLLSPLPTLPLPPPPLRQNLPQHLTDLPRHMRRITTDIEIGLLTQQVVYEGGLLAEQVLDVYLFWAFAREGVEDAEGGAEEGLVCLRQG